MDHIIKYSSNYCSICNNNNREFLNMDDICVLSLCEFCVKTDMVDYVERLTDFEYIYRYNSHLILNVLNNLNNLEFSNLEETKFYDMINLFLLKKYFP